MSYICPTCKKTREQLVEENKLNLVQGYEQCADCRADLEHESVVLRDDLIKKAKQQAVENNDYETHSADSKIAHALGVEPQEYKVYNWEKYLPEWYQEERRESFKKGIEEASKMKDIFSDYAKIID